MLEGASRNAVIIKPRLYLKPGEVVSVPRYARGIVDAVAGERVSVSFPNGEKRDFLRPYVSRLSRTR